MYVQGALTKVLHLVRETSEVSIRACAGLSQRAAAFGQGNKQSCKAVLGVCVLQLLQEVTTFSF